MKDMKQMMKPDAAVERVKQIIEQGREAKSKARRFAEEVGLIPKQEPTDDEQEIDSRPEGPSIHIQQLTYQDRPDDDGILIELHGGPKAMRQTIIERVLDAMRAIDEDGAIPPRENDKER